MRILVDACYHTGSPSGIARYIARTVPRLSRRADVTVMTTRPSLLDGSGCRTVRIPEWTRGFRRRTLWQLALGPNLNPDLCDVFLCPVPVAPPLARVPVVSVVHDLTPLALSRWHGEQQKTLFWLGLQSLRWASAVIADSEYTRHDLRQLRLVAPARIQVAPLGPGIERAAGSTSLAVSLKPYVLFVGCLYWQKNLVRLVSAFARLRDHSGLRLVFAGKDFPERVAYIRRTARNHGLEDRVLFLEDVSDSDLSHLYQNCEVFVLPSLYEGFGLPVLEAMTHGAPVVCSRTSSLPEVAGDAAVYFDPCDVDDMARAINLVLSRPGLAAELGRRGIRRAAAYTWDRTADVIYRTAVDVLAGRMK
ncbi:glycosyltransferase family 4 protein [candidate division WOR-3 bacterium]|nr:glycosyltransferase family 4 protein [candidate division WOR-3 bacterium]